MKLNDADKLYIGATPVDAVYVGVDKVWPSGFDPVALGGLVIWLDASQLSLTDGAFVSIWPSLVPPYLTGTNLNAVPDQPTLKAGGLNGLATVRFRIGTGLRWPNHGLDLNWSVIYVGRIYGPTPCRVITSQYPPSNLLIGFWNGFEDVCYVEGFLSPDAKVAQTTNWKLYSSWGEGVPGNAAAAFYRNGVLLSGGQPGSQNGGGWKGYFQLNGYALAENMETGECEVAEVLIYDRRLPDVDRANVENYLRTKWGLT